jgi:hypothetical protein
MNDSRYPEPPMSAVLDDVREITKDRFNGNEAAYAELQRRRIDEATSAGSSSQSGPDFIDIR